MWVLTTEEVLLNIHHARCVTTNVEETDDGTHILSIVADFGPNSRSRLVHVKVSPDPAEAVKTVSLYSNTLREALAAEKAYCDLQAIRQLPCGNG